MNTSKPAEVFPPGELIRDELRERRWTQAEFARILGRPIAAVNEIINGKRTITPKTAQQLATALGTSAEVWLNMEADYRLFLSDGVGDGIKQRARLYELAPIKEIERRQWIKETDSAEDLGAELKRFFDEKSLDGPPKIRVAARVGGEAVGEMTPARIAWCCRAMHLASTIQVKGFSKAGVGRLMERLRDLLGFPQEARKVPRELAAEGIRFVVVEHLRGTKIDGAALWLDEQSPVVALSLRFARIDNFWFTLTHELAHIKHEHTQAILDIDLLRARAVESDKAEAMERRANKTATETLIPPQELDSFIVRTKPYYSRERILRFAQRIGVHPGIIVGQLHYRGEISYFAHNKMLVTVRDIVTQEALTDGWGHIISEGMRR